MLRPLCLAELLSCPVPAVTWLLPSSSISASPPVHHVLWGHTLQTPFTGRVTLDQLLPHDPSWFLRGGDEWAGGSERSEMEATCHHGEQPSWSRAGLG